MVSSNGNSVAQKKGFQDQMLDDDLGLNWNTFKYRNYDPSLARFHNIDPLAEDYYYNSTYAFSENKVIQYNELEGLEATLPMIYGKIAQAVAGGKQFVSGAKETVVNKIKTKTPTATQKGKIENQRNLEVSTDKMISGLVSSGLPEAPSERQIIESAGHLGDAMVLASPLTGPFAPAVAGAGTIISSAAAIGEASLDYSEGNKDKIVTDAVVDGSIKVAEKALKVDKATKAVKLIKNTRAILYKEVIIPVIIEKQKQKK